MKWCFIFIMSILGMMGCWGKWLGKKLLLIVIFFMVIVDFFGLYLIILFINRNGNLCGRIFIIWLIFKVVGNVEYFFLIRIFVFLDVEVEVGIFVGVVVEVVVEFLLMVLMILMFFFVIFFKVFMFCNVISFCLFLLLMKNDVLDIGVIDDDVVVL